MDHIVLISKDILRKDYLPTYGNNYYTTPNIDELAKKGTVFQRHYTAAPSTAMSFTSMFTCLYPYQTGRSKYVEVSDEDKAACSKTLFDELEDRGYECHMLWSSNYIGMAERFSKCFGRKTIHHDKLELNQYVGAHIKSMDNEIKRDDKITEITYNKLINEIDSINRNNPIFLWVHLPHVFAGRTGYGDDIDILDRFVGDIRERFGDQVIITADHGCGNGKNGVTGYGFDLYESQICIPLITPRIEDKPFISYPTSNIQLSEIVLEKKCIQNEYIYSDTAYYAQPHRKLAIIKGNYKYIFEKQTSTEHLYDVVYDPDENIDLAQPIMRDVSRSRDVVTSQVLFYPYWDVALNMLNDMREAKVSMWKDASGIEKIKYGKWRHWAYTIRKRMKEIKRIKDRNNKKEL